MIKVINSSNFKDSIREGVTLVDFYADWCGPCQVLAPVIEGIASTRKDVEVYKINVDESPELAAEFGILSIPTVILFKDGEIKEKMLSANDISVYNNEIDKLID